MSEPLTFLVISFGSGILFSRLLYPPFSTFSFPFYFSLFLLFSIVLLLLTLFFSKRSRKEYLFLFLFFSFGFFNYQLFLFQSSDEISNFIQNKPVFLKGTVVSEPKRQGFNYQFNLRAEELFKGEWQRVKGKMNIQANQRPRFKYGDKLFLKFVLKKPPGPKEKGGFSQRDFLLHQGIYTTAALKKGNYSKIGKGKVNPLFTYIYSLKSRLGRILWKNIKSQPQLSIVEAMTLGKKSLPRYIKEPFRKTGLYHILVVSGLHVGFLLVLGKLILSLFSLPRKIESLLLILLIIFYAFLCGLARPVVRASLMATFYLFAYLLGREGKAVLSIIAASFLILLFNPEALFDPSWQLSTLITFGIITLSPQILKRWKKGPIWFRGTVAVCLTAQLTALPLLAYYFKGVSLFNFPLNLIFIPLAGTIVSFTFFTLIFGFLPFISHIFGSASWLLSTLLWKPVESLSHFRLSFLEIKPFHPLLLLPIYALLFFLFFFPDLVLVWKKRRSAPY